LEVGSEFAFAMEARDFFVLWELKLKLESVDIGIHNYICLISRSDKWNKYFVKLCDISQFYIIEGTHGLVLNVTSCSWTAAGSKDAILKVLRHHNLGFRLLDNT